MLGPCKGETELPSSLREVMKFSERQDTTTLGQTFQHKEKEHEKDARCFVLILVLQFITWGSEKKESWFGGVKSCWLL